MRVGARQNLYVYLCNNPDSILVLLGLLLYIDGGGDLTAVE